MGWSNQKLGDYCEVIAGQSPQSKYYNETGQGLPFYQGKKEFGTRYIGAPQKWTTKITKEAKADDILMSVRAPVGPINFSTENICIGRGLAAIRPSNELDKDFLFYYLLSKQDEIQGSEGAVFASINKSQIEALRFSYVNLEEQKRIVAILDQAFADINRIRSLTERNLNNTRELFESYLQQVFSQRGDEWVDAELGVLSDINYGYTEKASFEANGPHFLRITDIQGGNVDWSKVPYCPISEADHDKHKLVTGDIVFARTGATTGKSYLLNSPPDAVAASYLIRLRLTSDSILPEFVKFFFQTKGYWDAVNGGMSGSTQGGFNASKLSAIKMSYPKSIDTQKQLTEQLTFVNQQAREIRNTYKKKLSALDELKKSLLQKAFNGELTHSDNNEDAA